MRLTRASLLKEDLSADAEATRIIGPEKGVYHVKKAMMATALVVSSVALTAPAAAQPQQGLVNVNVTDIAVLNNFLNDTQIAALNNLNVPVTVQAPIGIAANVCGTTVAVLSAAGSAAACDAKSGSQALAQLVNKQFLRQKKNS